MFSFVIGHIISILTYEERAVSKTVHLACIAVSLLTDILKNM